MMSPFRRNEPSLTLRSVIRPAILLETEARVRATTYPLAVTAVAPDVPEDVAPPTGVATMASTATALFHLVKTRMPPTITMAMPARSRLRPRARRTSGGAPRSMRSFDRSWAGLLTEGMYGGGTEGDNGVAMKMRSGPVLYPRREFLGMLAGAAGLVGCL